MAMFKEGATRAGSDQAVAQDGTPGPLRVGNILFSGPMVRALLDGRKTQTRRLAWGQVTRPEGDSYPADWRGTPSLNIMERPSKWLKMHRRFEAAGHRELLYVREAFAGINGPQRAAYKADGDNPDEWKWTPSIHMPREHSRLTLEVTGTKLERLQDISEEDARAEGVEPKIDGKHGTTEPGFEYRVGFALLWNSLHGPDAWERNDEVIALSFRVHRCNVDEVTL